MSHVIFVRFRVVRGGRTLCNRLVSIVAPLHDEEFVVVIPDIGSPFFSFQRLEAECVRHG